MTVLRRTLIIQFYSGLGLVFMFRNIHTTDQELVRFSAMGAHE